MRMVEAVAISVGATLKILPKYIIAPTTSTSVSAAGRAFSRIFVMNLPRMRSRFGMNDRKNAGSPIVNTLMSEICEGMRGYFIPKQIDSIAIISEKIFFTMKRLPERSRLFTTFRPSATTSGIFEKSDSRSTSCAA